ncbi:transglycosylase SLT domain-containing protein [Ancylobacter terrae]|uniref:transglycosylase SLT domain-containing protein n=1 Tax=Ancylobacter sp. sgz301288 TaxID=3342077 RepID=UPI0038587634
MHLAIVTLALLGLLAAGGVLRAEPGAPAAESVEEAVCRLIDSAAAAHDLPTDFFTRLIWRESRFRADAVSPKGAQGIAQFMPGTAADRGLADPFDPEVALPASAALLADLRERFGNLGLAAAAYNAGPARVERWLAGDAGLPLETRAYLVFVTGREAEDWAAERAAQSSSAAVALPADAAAPGGDPVAAAQPPPPAPPTSGSPPTCLVLTASLRRGTVPAGPELATVVAPWGVQLSGNFSKTLALASYERALKRYVRVLEGTQPMIIGTRLRSRGSRTFYRVRVAQPSRRAASALCERLRAAGGACIVLPS